MTNSGTSVQSSARRLAVTAGLLSFVAYAYFYQAGGWNQNSRFDLVRALVEEQTASIDTYHRNTGDKACKGPAGRCGKANFAKGEHYYCDKAPGASLLAVIGYAPIYWIAGSNNPSSAYLDWSSHVATVISVAVPSAIGVAFLLLLLLHYRVGRDTAVCVTAAYAFGTLAFPYSTLLYGHQLAGALLIVGFSLLVWTPPKSKPTRRDLAKLGGAGFAFGFAVAVEYPAALAVMAISPWVLWRFRRRFKALAVYAGFGLLGGAAMFLYHWIVFGGPLVLPYEFVLMPERHQGAFMGIGSLSSSILWKVTFSAYRGLFFSAPWLLLGVVGLLVWWVRGERRAEMVIAAVISLLFIVLNASVAGWHGGWTLGPRYLVPALPFMALLVSGCLAPVKPSTRAVWPRRIAWLCFVVLAVFSMRNMLAATAVRPEVPQQVKRPFADFVDPQFASGQLAVNRQGIDQPAAPRGGDKKAFNLGMKIGLDGKTSLLPLLLLLLVLGAAINRSELSWLLRRRARRDSA